MLRISKIVDYGILVLTHMAARPTHVCSAAELASDLGLGQPVVSKVLKLLAQHGLVASTRGAHGGYRLGREAEHINVAQIIDALEDQPFGLTECTALPGACSVEGACHIRSHWQRINRIVRHTLESVTVADMLDGEGPGALAAPASAVPVPAPKAGARRAITNITNWSLSK
ncbi:SUF system Fe-S cluster assembly regulator [Castellaniella hirudinis]|uniref:SUF system Fe-S cluster assembly regulator n=1 Tax=Castellaniella hirudinis TaxID=1144617 RepID=A0ABV8S247_9BURK